MSERDYAPLSIACVRGLCDKIYDKRKFAGVEIEKMVKDFSDAKNTSQIKRLIRVLGQDLMSSTNPNVKNGALMGLTSVAVGLGKGCIEYLSELVHPIVACFSESESRVRYQAAEALFNVLKIARGAALEHFPLVFDALARLAADPEPQVKQGAELLDRLVKDIVTESQTFDLAAFIPMLRERIYTRNAFGRQFIVSWVSVLDAVPDIDLIVHLPELLDGLFKMLDDANPEIRRMCDVQLNEFLRSIKKDPSRVDFQAMINILITHAQSPEEMLQLTAITWIKEFVELAGAAMLPYASGILCAVLPCLAYSDEPRKSIRETAATVNFQLTKLVVAEPGGAEGAEGAEGAAALDVSALVGILSATLHHSSVHSKAAALDWLLRLYARRPRAMHAQTERLFVSLVASLTDAADDVVRRALAVLAEICEPPAPGDLESSPYYYKFLQALLRLLAADENLLEDRGAFIIRQLCILLNAEDIYKALARILQQERNLRFVATMVDVLNTILLTSAELYDLRLQLRNFNKPATHALFAGLYPCWCHSPVSLLALCLLTHNYAHCNHLISSFGDLEITVDFLTEVDKLVQLIESPIFAYLRLELLGGRQAAALRGALYGVLMLLPQSDAFHALRRRLHCAPADRAAPATPATPASDTGTADAIEPDIDFDKLLEEFKRVQAAHREYKMVDRSRGKLLDKGYS
ncbi:unnamed protein product [Chrysodeixis includens]|uniref:Protein VAC14 homolog n=1 Tax=Chrysodeixis includens TaxID=689277 RepID=A0A9P0BRP5_CHRIL|nr:unnamed protein product [Chrysodeixis includens]